MATGFQHLHNLMRWAVVVLALLTLIKSMRGLGGSRSFTGGDRKTALFLMISADVQLLLGIALYFMKGWASVVGNGGGFMKEAVTRYWGMEHAVGMILAIVLIHIGYAGTKGQRSDKSKFSRLFWCTLIALVVAAAVMPWAFRTPGIAKPWFPGMTV